MKKDISRRISLLVSFLCVLVVVAAVLLPLPSSRAQEATSTVLEKKTLARWPDPIVADVGIFKTLAGKKIEFLRVYAYRDGAFAPIPFQVDEKDAKGNMVLTAGARANPQDANGIMDKGEELSFMVRDSGDRIAPAVFPPGIELSEEMELDDPLTRGKGWVYLLYSESNPPPLSDKDYITYTPVSHSDADGDFLLHKTRYYECHHQPQEPYFDTSKYPNAGFSHNFYALTPEAGGTGVDFADRFKVRVSVAFLFGALKLHADENGMTFYENAYKDGPVRLIRNNKIIVSLPLGIKAPGAAVNIIWYDTIVSVPVIIDIPFNPGYLYTYLEISIGEDRSKEAIGMKVYNSNNLKGCTVDGKMDEEAELNWNTQRDQWRLITGRQGTLMNRSFWDERYLKQMASVKVEYFDDIQKQDPPEDVPGMIGAIRQTNRVEGIKKDRYYSYLEWYYPPSFLFTGPEHAYQVGDEKVYLDIADHPVKLRCGALAMESHYFGQMPHFEEESSSGK